MQPDTTKGSVVFATRSVSQCERAVLAQWFARTERAGPDAIAAAFVSERSRDDPRLRNMIVIAERNKADIAYLIHQPVDQAAWILACGRTGNQLGRFRTLPEALNAIRPTAVFNETALGGAGEHGATATNGR